MREMESPSPRIHLRDMCGCGRAVFTVAAFVLVQVGGQVDRILPSTPCPEIFNYVERLHNEIFGVIKMDNDLSGAYDLQVNMSIGMKTDKKIKIVRKTIEYKVYEGDSIEYYVIFPFNHTFPSLTSIKFNGKVYCTNPPDDGAVTTSLSDGYSFITKSVTLSYVQKSINAKYPYGECGLSNADTDFGPSRDHLTKEGAFPWLVPLFGGEPGSDYEYRCMGNLITNIHVLTAAHCAESLHRESMEIEFESHSTFEFNSTVKRVRRIQIHPEFISVGDADVAVIVMDSPVTFGPLLKPICLWDEPIALNNIGQRGLFAGYDRKKLDRRPLYIFRKLTMSIVSQSTCVRYDDKYVRLTSGRTFCASGIDGVVPCRGDNGGGFIVERNGKWTLRGIVTSMLADKELNDNCDNSYVVLTDVPKFNAWLTTILQEHLHNNHNDNTNKAMIDH